MTENPYASPHAPASEPPRPEKHEDQSLVRQIVSRGLGIGGLTGMATAPAAIFLLGLLDFFAAGPFRVADLPGVLLFLIVISIGMGIMIGAFLGGAAGILVAAAVSLLATFRRTSSARFLATSAIIISAAIGGAAAVLGCAMMSNPAAPMLTSINNVAPLVVAVGTLGGTLGGWRLARSIRRLLAHSTVSAPNPSRTNTSPHP